MPKPRPDNRPIWGRHLPVLTQLDYDACAILGWRIAPAALNQVYAAEKRFLFWHAANGGSPRVIYVDANLSGYVSHKMLARAVDAFDPERACFRKFG